MKDAHVTFFIAHGGRDAEVAKQLRNELHPDVPVYLEACDLKSWQQWDVELSRTQGRARATVALVSRDFEASYYLREEIASAIAYQRHDPQGHRLIVVFLDGIPSDPRLIPYGVRVCHSLDARELGIAGVAEALRRAARELPDASIEVSSSPRREHGKLHEQRMDNVAIFDTLCRLLPSQFDEVVFRVGVPRQHLAPLTEPLARRALDLVQWAEQEGERRSSELSQAIKKTIRA